MGSSKVPGIIAGAGSIREEFRSLRRKRALFRLSLEGQNSLTMTSDPSRYVVAACYDDGGYRGEPLRASAVIMDRQGRSRPVPFSGRTPGELLDAMEEACAEAERSAPAVDCPHPA